MTESNPTRQRKHGKMKTRLAVWAVLLAVAISGGLMGCSRSGNTATVDPAPLERSFASAEGPVKAAADNAAELLRFGDHAAALAELQKLAAHPQLTAEQKQAVQQVMEQLKKVVKDATDKVATEANKALENVQQGLGR